MVFPGILVESVGKMISGPDQTRRTIGLPVMVLNTLLLAL